MAERTLTVKEVYTYPIKSIRGISLPSLTATYSGFLHDRCFLLFHVAKEKNMHVPDFPEMCLFTTAFADAGDEPPTQVVVTYGKNHVFDHPDQKVPDEVLKVDLAPDTSRLAEKQITMHGSPCVGYEMDSMYSDWFSRRFGYEVKLLHIGKNRRKVLGNMTPSVAVQQRMALNESGGHWGAANSWMGAIASHASGMVNGTMAYLRGYEGEDEGISFADVAPYMIINTRSWENVQRRLPEGEVMDISKFRPNIIVDGAEEEFEEDYWADLQVGPQGAKLVLTQNCNRCNSINVDYETGKVGTGEAGKVLKKLQKDRRVDAGAKWAPIFGRYGFFAKFPEGRPSIQINVGDEVHVLKRNTARTALEWPGIG